MRSRGRSSTTNANRSRRSGRALREQGWLGLHIAEEHGGQGGGLLELAVVTEELARAMAPGPFLTTVLASALVERGGDEDTAARAPARPDRRDDTGECRPARCRRARR